MPACGAGKCESSVCGATNLGAVRNGFLGSGRRHPNFSLLAGLLRVTSHVAEWRGMVVSGAEGRASFHFACVV